MSDAEFIPAQNSRAKPRPPILIPFTLTSPLPATKRPKPPKASSTSSRKSAVLITDLPATDEPQFVHLHKHWFYIEVRHASYMLAARTGSRFGLLLAGDFAGQLVDYLTAKCNRFLAQSMPLGFGDNSIYQATMPAALGCSPPKLPIETNAPSACISKPITVCERGLST